MLVEVLKFLGPDTAAHCT